MKKLLLLPFLFLFHLNAFAQFIKQPSDITSRFRNSITVSSCFLDVPHEVLTSNRINDQYGLSISRRVYKNIGVSVGYSFWNRHNRLGGSNDYYIIVPSPDDSNSLRGSLNERHGYKFLDITAFVDHEFFKKQMLRISVGYTYCWGTNKYYKDFYLSPEPPYDVMYTYSLSNVSYGGIIAKVSYDFYLLKGRWRIGPEFSYRKYFSSYTLINFGVHAGVNF